MMVVRPRDFRFLDTKVLSYLEQVSSKVCKLLAITSYAKLLLVNGIDVSHLGARPECA